MEHTIASLMESQRLTIMDLIAAYMKISMQKNDMKGVQELAEDMKEITNKYFNELNDGNETYEYLSKVADYVIQKWEEFKKQEPKCVFMEDRNLLEKMQKFDPVFGRICQKIMTATSDVQSIVDAYNKLDLPYIG